MANRSYKSDGEECNFSVRIPKNFSFKFEKAQGCLKKQRTFSKLKVDLSEEPFKSELTPGRITESIECLPSTSNVLQKGLFESNANVYGQQRNLLKSVTSEIVTPCLDNLPDEECSPYNLNNTPRESLDTNVDSTQMQLGSKCQLFCEIESESFLPTCPPTPSQMTLANLKDNTYRGKMYEKQHQQTLLHNPFRCVLIDFMYFLSFHGSRAIQSNF